VDPASWRKNLASVEEPWKDALEEPPVVMIYAAASAPKVAGKFYTKLMHGRRKKGDEDTTDTDG